MKHLLKRLVISLILGSMGWMTTLLAQENPVPQLVEPVSQAASAVPPAVATPPRNKVP